MVMILALLTCWIWFCNCLLSSQTWGWWSVTVSGIGTSEAGRVVEFCPMSCHSAESTEVWKCSYTFQTAVCQQSSAVSRTLPSSQPSTFHHWSNLATCGCPVSISACLSLKACWLCSALFSVSQFSCSFYAFQLFWWNVTATLQTQ